MEEWKLVGQAERGVAIHFAKDGMARCDKTIPLIVFDQGGTTVVDITCAKCKQYKAYKDAVDTTAQKKPLDLETVVKKVAVVKEEKPSELLPTKATVKKKKAVKETKKESKPVVEEKETYDISMDEPDADFAAKKEKNGYNIIHIPTKTAMFNGVCQEVIEDALLNLNTIVERWPDTLSAVPKGFITKCRKALEEAFKTCGVEIPKLLADKVEEPKGKRKKPKKVVKKKFKKGDKKIINKKKVVYDGKKWIPETVRTIKRRPEKAEPEKKVAKKTIKRRVVKAEKKERTIKRRVVKEKGPFGMTPNKLPAIIAGHLETGINHYELVNILKKDFGLTEKRSRSKIKGMIRKLCRRKGIPVGVAMGKTIDEDYYKAG